MKLWLGFSKQKPLHCGEEKVSSLESKEENPESSRQWTQEAHTQGQSREHVVLKWEKRQKNRNEKARGIQEIQGKGWPAP